MCTPKHTPTTPISTSSDFWKEKYGGHKIFDDQNVGSHKMTTDSVFVLFKKTDFNTILACKGVRCVGDGGGVKNKTQTKQTNNQRKKKRS